MVQAPRGWHREDIKAAVRKTGITLKALALANGLTEARCRYALLYPAYKPEQVIAERIGVPAHELWPDRYDPDGNPLHPRLRRETSSGGPVRHRQRQAAA